MDQLENSEDDLKAQVLEMGRSFDEQVAKERAEYLAALNKQVCGGGGRWTKVDIGVEHYVK